MRAYINPTNPARTTPEAEGVECDTSLEISRYTIRHLRVIVGAQLSVIPFGESALAVFITRMKKSRS